MEQSPATTPSPDATDVNALAISSSAAAVTPTEQSVRRPGPGTSDRRWFPAAVLQQRAPVVAVAVRDDGPVYDARLAIDVKRHGRWPVVRDL